jgi:hypothetical protein
MNKILKIKNINIYLVIAFLVLLAFIAIFVKDTSNVQSAQPKEISLKPCSLADGIQFEAPQFKVGNVPYICRVLSEYLPLELDYQIVDLISGKRVSSEYIKITTYDFVIELSTTLEVGQYEFELREGMRRRIATTIFNIVK